MRITLKQGNTIVLDADSKDFEKRSLEVLRQDNIMAVDDAYLEVVYSTTDDTEQLPDVERVKKFGCYENDGSYSASESYTIHLDPEMDGNNMLPHISGRCYKEIVRYITRDLCRR